MDSNKMSTWNELLDEVKSAYDLKSDTKLAEKLGKTRSFISAVRVGRKAISIETAEVIFNLTGRDINNYIHPLFQPSKDIETTNCSLNLVELRAALLKRSEGICELCESSMPFPLPDGTPFFEMALIDQEASKVTLNENNYAALCPNCQKKLNILKSEDDFEKIVRKIS
jgi:plasmid maintenance system antidote protein VapI